MVSLDWRWVRQYVQLKIPHNPNTRAPVVNGREVGRLRAIKALVTLEATPSGDEMLARRSKVKLKVK